MCMSYWRSGVCSSDLEQAKGIARPQRDRPGASTAAHHLHRSSFRTISPPIRAMESQAAAIVRDFLRLRQEDQRPATAARPAVRHIVEIGPKGFEQRIRTREARLPFADPLDHPGE